MTSLSSLSSSAAEEILAKNDIEEIQEKNTEPLPIMHEGQSRKERAKETVLWLTGKTVVVIGVGAGCIAGMIASRVVPEILQVNKLDKERKNIADLLLPPSVTFGVGGSYMIESYIADAIDKKRLPESFPQKFIYGSLLGLGISTAVVVAVTIVRSY